MCIMDCEDGHPPGWPLVFVCLTSWQPVAYDQHIPTLPREREERCQGGFLAYVTRTARPRRSTLTQPVTGGRVMHSSRAQ